jgi:hypothetical protein
MPATGRHSPEQRWRKRAHENGNSSVIPISKRDHVNQIATAIPLGRFASTDPRQGDRRFKQKKKPKISNTCPESRENYK